LYFAAVESYFAANDIETSKRKLKARVRLPKRYKVNKEAIDASDIRDILLACTHDTLKVFLLMLASSGIRSIEALSLRSSDIDFSDVPTTIHIRPQISKTKQENYIYISNEASKHLKQFIDSKYSQVDEYKKYPNHLIFSKEIDNKSIDPINIYRMLHRHFVELLAKVEKDKRRDGHQRREITFHLLRTYVYTTISNTGDTQYAEWMLSHSGSTYWKNKEIVRRNKYLDVMPSLTFLDYPTVEAVGRDFVSKLKERDQQVEQLRDKISEYEFNEEQNKEYFKIKDKEMTELKGRIKKLEKLEKIVIDVANNVPRSSDDMRKSTEDNIDALEKLGYLETSDKYKKERKKYKNTKVFV
jgi:site-specific recombinase XerD